MSIRDQQRKFYGDLHRRHGDDPRSLSSRDEKTQQERFHRIAKLFTGATGSFRVHEIGCGLGHFGDFLREHHPKAEYSGSDIVEPFVERCRERHPGREFQLRDVAAEPCADRYEYLTLSGTFNVRLAAEPGEWAAFIERMLLSMWVMCTRGIAVTFLTTYHDADRADPALHYQSEKQILDFATSKLSRHVELDMAGPLYEYTLRIYRPEWVRLAYADEAFARYFRGSDDAETRASPRSGS
jgi:hypothetical protein